MKIEDKERNIKKTSQRITAKLQEFNIKEKEEQRVKYGIIYQSPASTKLMTADLKNIKLKEENNYLERNSESFSLTFKENKKNTKLSVSTLKLYIMGAMYLAKQNHFKEKNPDKLKTRVEIPLIEYASLMGKDVILEDDDIFNEDKEKKIKSRIDTARRKAKKDLDVMDNLFLKWEESGKTKSSDEKDYYELNILDGKGIIKGNIIMDFKKEFVHYLNNSYISEIPMTFFEIDERNIIAIQLAYKLCEHAKNSNNIRKGSNKRLKVETLLTGIGSLKTIEDLEEEGDASHWLRRIREPLENALDYLQDIKFLDGWVYTNEKSIPLKKTQEQKFDYVTFKNLYISYGVY